MKNYNILSLDGGGIRGLILLKQIIKLEKIIGKPLNQHFNLISGTSTGGIIAVLLSLGYSAEELLKIYTIHGEKIFNKQFLRFGFFRPKYNDKYFNKIIKDYVGDKMLKDIPNDLIVISYDADSKEKIIFKSRKAKVNDNYNYSLFDVIRSTASAPTFFKPHLVNKTNHHYVDGGLVINNPSMVSWVEALNYEDAPEKINIISFSTGTKKHSISKNILRGGILKWASPTVDILLAEQSRTTDYHMQNLYKREPGIYVRCNSIIKDSSGKIDDTSKKNINNMLLDGEFSAESNLNAMLYFVQNSL